jgi:hypothetical protein
MQEIVVGGRIRSVFLDDESMARAKTSRCR